MKGNVWFLFSSPPPRSCSSLNIHWFTNVNPGSSKKAPAENYLLWRLGLMVIAESKRSVLIVRGK